MWINEVMASSIEESYGLNLEWISTEGIGEEICGVDKECLLVGSSPTSHDLVSSSHDLVPSTNNDSDYIEIQVTEEEVVSDDWHTSTNGVGGIEFSLENESGYIPLSSTTPNECPKMMYKHSILTSHCASSGLDNTTGRQSSVAKHRQQRHRSKDHLQQKKKKKKAKWADGTGPKTDVAALFDASSVRFDSPRFDDMYIKEEQLSDVDFAETDLGIEVPISDSSPEVVLGLASSSTAVSSPNNSERFEVVDPRRPYVCQHCGVAFAREKALASHNMVHVGDSDFECDICGDVFTTEEQLSRHRASRHVAASSVAATFTCPLCPANFSWYNKLKRHQRTHHHMIKSEASEVDHNHEHQDGNGDGIEYDENDYDEDDNVDDDDHDDDEDYESGSGSGAARHHIVTPSVRAKGGRNVCHICSLTFSTGKALTKHFMSHVTDAPRPHPCPICHRNFYNRGKLKKHIRSVHESGNSSMAACNECGQKFINGSLLASHKQSIHGAGRLFPCTLCGKTFTSRSSQQIHVRVHTGEKPYGCRYCWKAFADGGTLRKHERIHTGEKPYVCPVCTKAFNQRVVLREHVRAHHSAGEGGWGGTRVFECIVCGERVNESLELCAHLVRHSDENTAKHRLPGTATRKYSRQQQSAAANTVAILAPRVSPSTVPAVTIPTASSNQGKRRRSTTNYQQQAQPPPAKSYAARYAVTTSPPQTESFPTSDTHFPDAPIIVGRKVSRRNKRTKRSNSIPSSSIITQVENSDLMSDPPSPLPLLEDDVTSSAWDPDMGVSIKLEK